MCTCMYIYIYIYILMVPQVINYSKSMGNHMNQCQYKQRKSNEKQQPQRNTKLREAPGAASSSAQHPSAWTPASREGEGQGGKRGQGRKHEAEWSWQEPRSEEGTPQTSHEHGWRSGIHRQADLVK